ncbi:MAG: TonB-dependent receptor [Sphingobacteriaceae bacterium]|nr:MAG: TonB-dependent receptor [Sphingobacteriaceae bacterium]
MLVILTLAFQLLAYQANAQTGNVVKGQVKDATTGELLPGVVVKVQGTSTGTSTDMDGRYSIKAPATGTLLFSFMGYVSTEQPINSQANLNIKLTAESKALTEVVVVGYGSQRKASLTTAVASIDGKTIAARGTVSPVQALQGQVAGVDIRSLSGRAGSTTYGIQIRGQNSLAGGKPLFVVDGNIVDDINYLNPQDIGKIDVLKDAASTAIYGSRGSNGVILISTKLGETSKGVPTISLDSYYGIRSVARMPDFMNGDEQWDLLTNTIITNAIINNTPYDINIATRGNSELLRRVQEKDYFNWRDAVLKTGSQQNHWLSASGTSNDEKIRYVLGAGYQNEDGNLVQESIKKYNFKASIDARISDQWLAGININYTYSNWDQGSPVAINNAFRQLDVYSPYDIKDGSLTLMPGQVWDPKTKTYTGYGTFVNPLIELENSVNNTKTYNALGNLFLQFSPVKWINIRSTFSPKINSYKNGLFDGQQTQARNGLKGGAAKIYNRQSMGYLMENLLTANKTYKDHNFSFTALQSMQSDADDNSSAEVAELPFDSGWYNLGSTTNRVNTWSSYGKSTLISYMARLNYSYKDRYLATLVNRWDGSSKLADGHKWASFPSAAVAWRFSQEPFFEKVTFVSDAKLRFSAGESGNYNNISPYDTQSTLSSSVLYDFGGTTASGYTTGALTNRNLTWERTREFNLGLDFELFKGRISGTVDVYDKLSKGVLMDRNIPVESGWSVIKDNVGSVSNRGIEVSLRTMNVATKDFSWSTSFTFAHNKNAIRELLDKKEDLVGNGWFIGKPINVFYNYVLDGVWQESEKEQALIYSQTPGQSRVKDLNNDGVITSADDKTIIGQQDPKWTGGFSTHIVYKQFDFSASLFARQGLMIQSHVYADFLRYDGLTNYVTLKMGDYYMPANNATPARSSNFLPQPNNAGSYWRALMPYTDGSFVKIQNLTLGYTVPGTILQKAKIKALRLYVNVLNPFVFTKYKGFDPETDGDVNTALNESGVGTITYQLGLNLKF